MVTETLGKNLGPPMPKRSNDPYRISNLILHLTEITRFQKHIDGLLTHVDPEAKYTTM